MHSLYFVKMRHCTELTEWLHLFGVHTRQSINTYSLRCEQLWRLPFQLCDCLYEWEVRQRDVLRGRISADCNATLSLRMRHYWRHLVRLSVKSCNSGQLNICSRYAMKPRWRGLSWCGEWPRSWFVGGFQLVHNWLSSWLLCMRRYCGVCWSRVTVRSNGHPM